MNFLFILGSTVILNVKLDSSRNLELRIYEIFGSRKNTRLPVIHVKSRNRISITDNPTIGVIVRSY